MWTNGKNDQTIINAMKAQSQGDWQKSAALLQDAGNQYRNPKEKQMLWDAAQNARRIANSD